jgi:uncharacterized membrane protein YcaP (DUF421 family)
MSLLELFEIRMPVWEIMLRGSVVYLSLFAIFRFVIRRDVGAVGVADLMLLVLVADAAQNAMGGGYETIAEGMLLVATLVGWNVLFDWLAFHSPAFAKFAVPKPLLLVRNGRLIAANLRREFITREELVAKLRAHGVDDLREVAKAYLESDGEVSVVKRDGGDDPKPPKSARDSIA